MRAGLQTGCRHARSTTVAMKRSVRTGWRTIRFVRIRLDAAASAIRKLQLRPQKNPAEPQAREARGAAVGGSAIRSRTHHGSLT